MTPRGLRGWACVTEARVWPQKGGWPGRPGVTLPEALAALDPVPSLQTSGEHPRTALPGHPYAPCGHPVPGGHVTRSASTAVLLVPRPVPRSSPRKPHLEPPPLPACRPPARQVLRVQPVQRLLLQGAGRLGSARLTLRLAPGCGQTGLRGSRAQAGEQARCRHLDAGAAEAPRQSLPLPLEPQGSLGLGLGSRLPPPASPSLPPCFLPQTFLL